MAMEVYCTKKVENVEGFQFDVPDSLPFIHIITPEVIVKCDHNDNFYIADCPSDPNFIPNIIKFKKVMAKNSYKEITKEDKAKLQDDVIWIKPSPIMIYKKQGATASEYMKFNRMLLNHPLSLQLSYTQGNFQYLPKPYNTYNIFMVCDVVKVPDDFNWNILAP